MTTTDMLSTLSVITSLTALLVSMLVARAQISLTRREHLFSVIGDVLAAFHHEDFKEAREYVKQTFVQDNPPDEDGKVVFTVEARGRIQPVLALFFRVGLLVHQRAISVELISAYMGRSIIDCWTVLRPYIYSEREKRADPNYYGYFEHLAAEVRHYGNDKLTRRLRIRRWD